MAVLTRIQNNQITDNTINAQYKIATGTITGNLFATSVTLNSNVTILGNLSVSGNTSTLNSVNTYINDPIVVFNNGYTGSISGYNIGIMVNRNYASLGAYGSVNTAWVWVENDQAFEAIATTTTGNAFTTLTNSGWANVKVGNLTAQSLNLAGGISISSLNGTPIGNTTPSTGGFTYLVATTGFSTANAIITGGNTTSMTAGSFTTLQGTNLSSGNAQITGGAISGTPISGSTGYFTTAQATNLSSGNVLFTGGNLSGITNFNGTTLQSTNISTANIVITSGTATTLQATNFSSGNAVITGGSVNGTAIGGTTPAAANFTTAQTNNFSTANAQITGGAISGLSGGTGSNTAATTQTLRVSGGGLGVVGDSYLSGNVGVNGVLSVAGALVPTANVTYDLGTTSARWRSLYLSGNTIDLGGASISASPTAGLSVNYGINNTVIGNVTPTTATFTTASANTGYIAALNATNGNVTTLVATTGFSTANAQITGGYTTGMTTGSFTTLQGTNFSTGNAQITGGSTTGMTAGSFTTLQATNLSSGNAQITGGNITANYGLVTNFSTANAQITGGAITGTPISGSTGSFTTGLVTNFSTGNAVITGGSISGISNLSATTLQATNFSTANAVITGGTATNLTGLSAVTGNVATLGVTNGNIGTLVVTTGFSTANAQITSGNISGITSAGFTTLQATNFSTGNAQITGGAISGTPITGSTATFTTAQATNFSSGNAVITGGTATNLTGLSAVTGNVATLGVTSGNIGTLVVTTGLSTANAVVTGGSINNTTVGATTPNTGAFTTLTASGTTTFTNSTDSTGLGTGAVQVTGGASVLGNLWVGGNIFGNLTSQISTILSVNDPLLYLNASNPSNYNYDIGFYSHFVGGSGSTYQHTGLTRDYVTNTWKFFSNVPEPVAGITNYTNAIYDPVEVGSLIVANARVLGGGLTANTGAVQVWGDASVTGNLYAGGNVTTTNVNASQVNVTNSLFVGGTIYGTFSGVVSGGAGAANVAYFLSETNATSNATYYPIFGNVAGANAAPFTNTSLNYNPSTGVFAAGNFSGAGTFTTAVATNFSSGNAVITGGSVNGTAIGGTTPAAANFTTAQSNNFSSANAVVTGGSINGTAIGGTTPAAANFTTAQANNFSSANAIITGGNTTSMTAGSFTTLQGTNFSSGNAQITGGAISGTPITGSTATFTTAQATNFSSANAVITGGTATNLTGLSAVTGNIATLGVTNGNITTLVVTTGFSTANAQITGGNTTGMYGGTFTTLQATNFSSGNAVITGGTATNLTGLSAVTGNVATLGVTNGNIGTLVVTTGFSTANAQITGGNVTANYGLFTNLSTANALITGGSTTGMTSGSFTTLQATNFSSGNAVITGGTATNLTGLSAITGNVATLGVTNGNVTTLVATNFSSGNVNSISGSAGTLVVTNFSTANAKVTGGTVDGTAIGATTASTGAFTTLSSSGVTTHGGNVVITSGTTAIPSSSTQGALVITGAGGIVTATGNAVIGGTGYFGPAQSTIGLANPLIVATGSANGYAQVQAQNTSSGNAASTDFVATANNGTDTANYIDMGINGSGFSQSANNWYISGANDGYVYVDGGNLTLGTDSVAKTVAIHVGGLYANNVVATFANVNTVATSTTGALTVVGGASFGNNAVISQGANINVAQSTGANSDLYMSGKNDKTLLWAHAGTYDSVVIGNSATSSTLVSGAKLQINSSDSILLPVGSNSQRPSASGLGTDTVGMLRYSNTSNSIEWYTGTQWQAATTSFTIIQENQYNGDGSTVAFTLPTSTTTAGVIVSINGIVQIGGAGYAYTVSGTTLTFSQAPASGDVIDTRVITTTATVQNLSSSTGYTNIDVSSDTTGIKFQTGTAGAGNVFIMPPGGGLVTGDANVAVSSANSATTLDSFTAYRSAKYIIQATNGSNYQAMEALVVTTGSTAQVVTYGTVNTGGNLGVVAATASAGTTTVQFIAANASTNVRLWRQYLPI